MKERVGGLYHSQVLRKIDADASLALLIQPRCVDGPSRRLLLKLDLELANRLQ